MNLKQFLVLPVIIPVIALFPLWVCSADVEKVILVKSINDEKFIIQRPNGELWLLEARTFCFWTWLKEGMVISANFGYLTTTLINPDDGETCNCRTEKQLN